MYRTGFRQEISRLMKALLWIGGIKHTFVCGPHTAPFDLSQAGPVRLLLKEINPKMSSFSAKKQRYVLKTFTLRTHPVTQQMMSRLMCIRKKKLLLNKLRRISEQKMSKSMKKSKTN